jgi:hypothetical protein
VEPEKLSGIRARYQDPAVAGWVRAFAGLAGPSSGACYPPPSMPAVGYVLAPVTPVPAACDAAWRASVQSWVELTGDLWAERVEALPREVRARVPRRLSGRGISSNGADASARGDPAVVVAARAWIEASFRAWWDEGGGTAAPPVNDVAACHAAMGLTSRVSLGDLLLARPELRPVGPRAPRGDECVRLLAGAAPRRERPPAETELAIVREIARALGGDHLALWTEADRLQIWLAGRGGRRHRFTLAADEARRVTDVLPALRKALDDTRFSGHAKAVERAVGRDRLDAGEVFAAFGLPLRPVGALAGDPWGDLESVATALLRGAPPKPAARGRLRKVLAAAEGEAVVLPATAQGHGSGRLARAVAEAARALEQIEETPRAGQFAARFPAVRAAVKWLGDQDADDLAAEALLPRLVEQLPPPLRADPIALALLAAECEVWNAHGLVSPLARRAERSAQGGGPAGAGASLLPPRKPGRGGDE